MQVAERSDRGTSRIDPRLRDFILKTYREGNKGSRRMTRKQVYIRTRSHAEELGLKTPSHMRVYRVLEPVIEAQEQKKKIRSPGWLSFAALTQDPRRHPARGQIRGDFGSPLADRGTEKFFSPGLLPWIWKPNNCPWKRREPPVGIFATRENRLTPSRLGQEAGIGAVVSRWEKFRFNPPPCDRELEKLAAVVGVDAGRLREMLPPAGAGMKMTPIRLCGACYGETPCHPIEWQLKATAFCSRHQLTLLSECPGCGARFQSPALWVDGRCHRCFLPFAQMRASQKRREG